MARTTRELYDEVAGMYVAAKKLYHARYIDPADQFILQYIGESAGKVLLDVGCGSGDEAAHYEKMSFACVRGVDPSATMLDLARRSVAHPENFTFGAYERTGLKVRSVDIIVGRYSLHYVASLDRVHRELARILRPGGLLILTVRHPFTCISEPQRFRRRGRIYVESTIYQQLPLPCPLHTVGEYLSPEFFRYFTLEVFTEWSSPDATDPHALPFMLGMVARRRV